MRWFLGYFTLLAVIAGAVVGGGFLAPREIAVARAIEIGRSGDVVFPLLSNLKSFVDFSPWNEIDPTADFVVEGPPGIGQTLKWKSAAASVGAGIMRIESVEPMRRVAALAKIEESPPITLRFLMSRAQRQAGVRVTWQVERGCPEEFAGLACRYGNFIAKPWLESNMEEGLAKLKTLAESIPDVDIAALKVSLVQAPKRVFIYHEGDSAPHAADMAAAEDQALAIVEEYMLAHGVARAGSPIVETLSFTDKKYGFRAGYPFEGPAPAVAVNVKAGPAPSGLAARTIHQGPRETLGETYARLTAYLRAHRVIVSGSPWQVYEPAQTPDGPATIIIHLPVEKP